MSSSAACLPHILLIEDDVPWGRMLSAGLDLRSRLDWARNLEDARRLLEDRSYELLVSDLCLGTSDARPLLSELGRTELRPRVLLISGHMEARRGGDPRFVRSVKLHRVGRPARRT